MQNDFIDGSLGTAQAQQIVPNVISKLMLFLAIYIIQEILTMKII